MLEDGTVDEFIERCTQTLRRLNLYLERFGLADLLNLYPATLLLCDEHIVKFFFLFNRLEVVNDNADEEVDNELTANDHEDDEECEHEQV